MPPPNASEPHSLPNRHRLLSPSISIKVSPLALGGMSFGTSWSKALGGVDKETAFSILDYYRSQGGNFIDTANGYQDNQSEEWIGQWMADRGCRDEMVVATKFTANYRAFEQKDESSTVKVISNFGGNGNKSLRLSLEASLKKLRTDYIDIMYLHWWEFIVSIPEFMNSLNDMVRAGKILYHGISNTPAWIVSKANQYARDFGLRQFVVYQGEWNAAKRDFEREIIPMCADEQMGLCPWGALGGGKFKRDEDSKKGEGRGAGELSEQQVKVSAALEKLTKDKGSVITGVALAYVLHKAPYVSPICGRTMGHLKGNIKALTLSLLDDEINEIGSAWPFDVGFSLSFWSQTPAGAKGPGHVALFKQGGKFDYVEAPKPIGPRQR